MDIDFSVKKIFSFLLYETFSTVYVLNSTAQVSSDLRLYH
jgi:hypothetical protein